MGGAKSKEKKPKTPKGKKPKKKGKGKQVDVAEEIGDVQQPTEDRAGDAGQEVQQSMNDAAQEGADDVPELQLTQTDSDLNKVAKESGEPSAPSQQIMADSRTKTFMEDSKQYPTPPISPADPSQDVEGEECQYLALLDFNSRNENEISFKKGDVITVTKKPSKHWWTGRVGETEGTVPASYVIIRPESTSEHWFMESCTRDEAEKLLMKSKQGAFLVRPKESRSEKPGYSLSVRASKPDDSGKVHIRHFKVFRAPNTKRTDEDLQMYYISERTTFDTLDDLITYYQAKTFSDRAGVRIRLGEPCTLTEQTSSAA